jgi:hypothetical protein
MILNSPTVVASGRIALLAVSFVLGLQMAGAGLAEAGDYDADVKACLASWGEHPFDADAPKYRVIAASVKILGIGSNVKDDARTSSPELVYIRPSVSVWSKLTMDLLNPDGWYCVRTNVSVMAKAQINLACRAHFASTSEGTNVMGGGTEGVNVMGATQIDRIGCD